MAETDQRLLQGTLELLILKTVSWGAMHGYGIARWIEQVTGDVLQVEEGSLYPALHRLERKGLVEAEWGQSENNRRAKYYRLTPEGREALRRGSRGWARLADAVSTALGATDAPAWATP